MAMALFDRLARVGDAASDVASAHLDLAASSARAAVRNALLLAAAGALAGIGALTAAAAGVLALIPLIGVVGALLVIAGVLLVLAIAFWLWARSGSASEKPPTVEESRQRVAVAKAQLADAVTPDAPEDPAQEQPQPTIPGRSAIDAALANPKLLTSAGFAAVTLFGPGRLLKIAARGAATAAAISTVMDTLKKTSEPQNGRPPPAHDAWSRRGRPASHL